MTEPLSEPSLPPHEPVAGNPASAAIGVDPRHVSVLAADPRGYPGQGAQSSSGKVVALVVTGCALLLLAFIAFIGFAGWMGYRAARDARQHQETTGKPDYGDGKPTADAGDRSADPAAWVTSDDYPPDALNRGEQGTTEIAWEVAPNGMPLRCTVRQSSGSPTLDSATCAAFMRHAQFDALPAGQVPVRSGNRRVSWRLPDGTGDK